MSEGVNNEPPNPSRRRFLRLLGIGAGAATVSAITACAPGQEKSAEIDKKDLSFKEVDNGTKIPLVIEGVATEVLIAYIKDNIDPLQIRQRGEGNVTKLFEDGTETIRKFGEITDPNLYEIKGKNPNLGEEITVGVYPTTNGNKISISGREDLGNSKLYALKVVVNGSATENYGIDNPPLETNKNYHKNNSLSVPEFGQGLAVGHLVDGEMNKVFYVEGFICDDRAVVLE